ncbi:MAG TPA: hypothetical protein VFA65_11615 [Bryobacteraceae bacterium]|nr:hypothetical protein [Bryobacteraceae bacterium]
MSAVEPHRMESNKQTASDRVPMWVRSSDIMNEIAREVSGRAEAAVRRKPGVFKLADTV